MVEEKGDKKIQQKDSNSINNPAAMEDSETAEDKNIKSSFVPEVMETWGQRGPLVVQSFGFSRATLMNRSERNLPSHLGLWGPGSLMCLASPCWSGR